MDKKFPKIKLPGGRELRSQAIMAVGGVILIYIVVSTVQALWQNYQLDRELLHLREETAELKLHNKYLQNLIAYRKTESFKDKEARSKLNYQKPGELVLIIPENDIERFTEGNIKTQEQDDKKELTNPGKWWQYIFG